MKKNILPLAVLSVLPSAALFGLLPQAAAANPTYSFNLVGPDIARAEDGATIRLTGSGSFDPLAGTIVGSGSFTHVLPDGAVFAKGTWVATSFGRFLAFDGPNPGLQGGKLELTVTLFPKGGDPVPGLPMSVVCLINKPPDFNEEEGVTLAEFTESIHGTTLFHLNQ